jgi:Family of unknown function (DUF5681)
MEIDEKIGAESLPKEHGQEHSPAEPTGEAPAEPHTTGRTPPEGRRWVKGQSGNPRGRPSRAHKAAYVAHAMLDDKTIQLLDKVIGGARAATNRCCGSTPRRWCRRARRCRSG